MDIHHDLRNVEILTDEQQKECFQRMQAGDQEARHQLINSMLRLAYGSVAKIVTDPSVRDECLSFAFERVVRAVDKWDGQRPLIKLINTVVMSRIKRDVYLSRLVALPVTTGKHVSSVYDLHDVDSIQERLQCSKKRAKQILLAKTTQEFISIDAPAEEKIDIPETAREGGIPGCLADVTPLIQYLSPMEQEIISNHLGLLPKLMTLREIRNKYQLPHGAHAKILARVIKKLKDFIENPALIPNIAEPSHEELVDLYDQGRLEEIILAIKHVSRIAAAATAHKLRCLTFEELEAAALLGIVKAVNRWHPKDGKLIPKAVIAAKGEIYREYVRTNLVYIPRYAWERLKKLNHIAAARGDKFYAAQQDYVLQSYARMVEITREQNVIEIIPGVFPCLALVESRLKDVTRPKNADLFARKYGLLNYHSHTYEELVTLTRRSVTTINSRIISCIRELQRMFDPDWQLTYICAGCHKEKKNCYSYPFQRRVCSRKCHALANKSTPDRDFVNCAICNTKFLPKRKTQILCSRECVRKHRAKKYSTKANFTLTGCVVCGTKFLPTRKTQVLCSKKCEPEYLAKKYFQRKYGGDKCSDDYAAS